MSTSAKFQNNNSSIQLNDANFTHVTSSQKTNAQLIEDLFLQSLAKVDASFNKIKKETNKLLLESELNKNKKELKRIKRKNLKFNTNQLNKSSRLKHFFELIEPNITIIKDVNQFKPKLPNDNDSKLVLPFKAVIKVEKLFNSDTELVSLTWDLINLVNEIDCKNTANQEIYSNIKEYEIYIYKLNLNSNKSDNHWVKIGTVEPYTPPVKCTLSDFEKNCKYYFTIRINSKHNLKSDFSEPVSIVL